MKRHNREIFSGYTNTTELPLTYGLFILWNLKFPVINIGVVYDACREMTAVAYPGILFGGGGPTNSVEHRGQKERGSGGGSPLVRRSGGSCTLVQEIPFHIVKLSSFLTL